MSDNFEKVKEEVFEFMSKGNYKAPSMLLINTFKSIKKADIPRFGDLLAEIARKFPEIFREIIYIAFQYYLRNYKEKDILFELEKYFLEKFCLMSGEIIIDSFYGSLRETYTHINKGRIFVTNARVIACGYGRVTGATVAYGPRTGKAIKKDFLHAVKGTELRKSMSRNLESMNIIPYGFSYPIHSAHKIKRGKSAITYWINVKIYITPGKMNDRARKEEILNNIENILIKNQL